MHFMQSKSISAVYFVKQGNDDAFKSDYHTEALLNEIDVASLTKTS